MGNCLSIKAKQGLKKQGGQAIQYKSKKTDNQNNQISKKAQIQKIKNSSLKQKSQRALQQYENIQMPNKNEQKQAVNQQINDLPMKVGQSSIHQKGAKQDLKNLTIPPIDKKVFKSKPQKNLQVSQQSQSSDQQQRKKLCRSENNIPFVMVSNYLIPNGKKRYQNTEINIKFSENPDSSCQKNQILQLRQYDTISQSARKQQNIPKSQNNKTSSQLIKYTQEYEIDIQNRKSKQENNRKFKEQDKNLQNNQNPEKQNKIKTNLLINRVVQAPSDLQTDRKNSQQSDKLTEKRDNHKKIKAETPQQSYHHQMNIQVIPPKQIPKKDSIKIFKSTLSILQNQKPVHNHNQYQEMDIPRDQPQIVQHKLNELRQSEFKVKCFALGE